MIRAVVYVEKDTYNKLKSRCALSGISVSHWFRLEAEDFIDGDPEMSGDEKIVEPKKEKKERWDKMSDEEIKEEVEYHQCSWNKAFQCTSPGVVKKGKKWYCSVHATL